MSAPEGWSSDLTIVVGRGTLAELVEFIIGAGLAGAEPVQTCADIETRFQLSSADAELAVDRTYGGIVRAKTRNPLNCPDPDSDPIAFESHGRASRDRTIIERLGV